MKIEDQLHSLVARAIQDCYPHVERSKLCISPSTHKNFGDFQSNIAMQLTKELKQNPLNIAETLVETIKQIPSQESVVTKIEAVKPGFINIFLNPSTISEAFIEQMHDPFLGVVQTATQQTVVIDYGSPNVAKSLHIGHLRSMNIGNALDRIYRFLGFHVVADNHLGDWGTQFGMLIYGYKHYLNKKAFDESPIDELERIYIKTNQESEINADIKDEVRAELVKLQQGNPEHVQLWQMMVNISIKEIDALLDRLDIRFDITLGESFYHFMLGSVVQRLKDKEIARLSEGAWAVFFEPSTTDSEKLPPAIIQKKDGGFNYASTDIATIIHRLDSYPDLTRIVYVTDERQQLHFKQIFAIASQMGLEPLNSKVHLEHVWFGLMRMAEGTFSSRSGNVIHLSQLLDEAERRSYEVVKAASPELSEDEKQKIAKVVGISAVKYADLSQNRQSLVIFDWDKMLALDGNTAPYLLYSYARIRSIFRKVSEREDISLDPNLPLHLDHETERELALMILRFPAHLLLAAESYKPNVLCDYLFGLATLYNRFYQNVPVLKAPDALIRNSRLLLCQGVSQILKTGLSLLGIAVLERM